MYARTRFLDGFEVHFLCEYTGYWHMTDDVGFWLGSASTPSSGSGATPGGATKRVSGTSGGTAHNGAAGGCGGVPVMANQVPILLNLALSLVQIVQGIPEHSNNCRLIAPVVTSLLKTYEYLRAVDTHAQPDTCAILFYWIF